MRPSAILFGAGFTGVTSLALGLLVAQALKLRLYRGEVVPLAFLLGSATLSTIVFALLTCQMAWPWSFATVGILSIAACIWRRPWSISDGPAPSRLPVWWRGLFTICLVVYGIYTFVNAMAPETSPDGVAYHLGLVGQYFRTGAFERYTTSMYANLPMGVDLLFLFAYSFGRHSAAALVHWQFLMVLPFLLLACGRRFGFPVAGAIAGLLVFVSPVAAVDGSSAYVDVAAAALVFGLYFLLVIWEQRLDTARSGHGSEALIGVLAGFCYCCKMTAAPAIPLAVGFVAWRLWRNRTFSWRPVAMVAVLAFAVMLPWLAKNAILVGNPFSPFLNRLFPNPHVRISFEEDYRKQYRTYYGAIKSPSEIPLEVTVKGLVLNGLFGPVFLLAPLGLLALRWPLGRSAWLAAFLFASTYPGNIGTRFLLTSLPFVSLALGLVLQEWRGMGTAIVLFHAFLSWPDAITLYSNPYVWRLDQFRLEQALRRESEDHFLARTVEGYPMARLAEAKVPPSGHIFTFGGIAQGYSSRRISVAYEAGRNNAAGEILAAGVAGTIVASEVRTFRFAPESVRRLRLVQTATTDQIWSVSELRVLSAAGVEISRENGWRIKASPNPWDVQWAFDNCPVTRWKAWDRAREGQHVEIDLGKLAEIGGLSAEMSGDQPATRIRVDVDDGNGKWKTVATRPEVTGMKPLPSVRRTAVDDLKRMGYTHLIVARGEFLTDDVFQNEAAWGLTLLGDTGHARLYRMD